ncbi:MAG: diguanylate cyclase [Patescibacteria group bacterium]
MAPPSPEFIDRERIGTVKRSYERKTLEEGLRAATVKQEMAQTSHPDDASAELAKADVEIAKKRLELFDAEHDPSGAWKSDRFGIDVAKMFEHDFVQEAHGKLVPTEELKQTHLLTVSMNELDRLNKEGGHSLGDEGMSLTYKLLAERVEQALHALHPEMKESELAENYDIYRSGGNEFSVVVRKVTSVAAMQSLADGLKSVDAVTQKYANVEAPPLAANHASMAEVYEVLNALRREEGMEGFMEWEQNRKAGLAVDVIKDVLMTENDISKTQLRLDRFEGMLKEAATSGDETRARAFYDNYLKKALGGMFADGEVPASYEEAKGLMKQMGAFDESWSGEWQKEKSQIAFDEGFKSLRLGTEAEITGERNLQSAIATKARQRFEQGQLRRVSAVEKAGEFVPPEPTEGLRILAQKRAEAEEAARKAEAEPTPFNQKQKDLKQLESRLEAARRDSMTGLEARGPLFAGVESALSRNQSVSTMFIDMGFLKYFDKVGGPAVGDLAIKKSGEILDRIANRPDWKERFPDAKIKAYRYAGDEFVLTVEGDDGSLAVALRQAIAAEAEMAGPVPGTGVDGSLYTPSSIVFNVGISHVEDTAKFEKLVEGYGLPLHGEKGSKDRINHLAEYAIRFADREIDIEKAMDRYERLADLVFDRGEDDPYVKQMLAYSQKATYGKEGETKVLALAAAMSAERSAEGVADVKRRMMHDLLEFTLGQKDKDLEEKAERDRAAERRIEEHVREQYFERRIKSLEEAIGTLETSLKALQGENAELRANLQRQKAALEEDRDKIKGLRERMGVE